MFLQIKRDANSKKNFNSAIKERGFHLHGQTLQFAHFFFLKTLYSQILYRGSLKKNFANKLFKYKSTTENIGCLEIFIYV